MHPVQYPPGYLAGYEAGRRVKKQTGLGDVGSSAVSLAITIGVIAAGGLVALWAWDRFGRRRR